MASLDFKALKCMSNHLSALLDDLHSKLSTLLSYSLMCMDQSNDIKAPKTKKLTRLYRNKTFRAYLKWGKKPYSRKKFKLSDLSSVIDEEIECIIDENTDNISNYMLSAINQTSESIQWYRMHLLAYTNTVDKILYVIEQISDLLYVE